MPFCCCCFHWKIYSKSQHDFLSDCFLSITLLHEKWQIYLMISFADFKSKMSLIVSVHVYSVQKALLKDSGPLYSVDYDAVKDNLRNCSRYFHIFVNSNQTLCTKFMKSCYLSVPLQRFVGVAEQWFECQQFSNKRQLKCFKCKICLFYPFFTPSFAVVQCCGSYRLNKVAA